MDYITAVFSRRAVEAHNTSTVYGRYADAPGINPGVYPSTCPIEFDYHRSVRDGKWYWAMISYGNIIARSTDPQKNEVFCLAQILEIVNSIRGDLENIPPVKRREPGGRFITWIHRR